MADTQNRNINMEEPSAVERLRSFVSRIESLQETRKEIAEDIKDVYAEAKGEGFDVAALKRVIKDRSRDIEEVLEQEGLVELYRDRLLSA